MSQSVIAFVWRCLHVHRYWLRQYDIQLGRYPYISTSHYRDKNVVVNDVNENLVLVHLEHKSGTLNSLEINHLTVFQDCFL